MAKTLDDIFDDDDFGLLNHKEKSANVKTDEDRLIDSFEEINAFYEKNNSEPSTGSMSEYSLSAKLKGFRSNDSKKKILKPFDRFNLLGEVEMKKKTLDDILAEDDLGLLNPEGDLSIFEFRHTRKIDKRADADFVAQRTSIPDKDFEKYEAVFKQVHQDLKSGKRKLLPAENVYKNIQVEHFYLLDGMLLYLQSAVLNEEEIGGRKRLDGRTVTIFENATKSTMLYRSLGKAIQKSGKVITDTDEDIQYQLNNNVGLVKEEDLQSGWVYVLKSKSKRSEIANLEDLFKIGFSTTKVIDRIKNASREATYLFSDVEVIATYSCYNLNVQAFEKLIHRFFAESCLNVDIYDADGRRLVPREWFVVPLPIIDEAINLLIMGTIVNYRYDNNFEKIVLK
ncbi:GIY-YIG nuclease family protein [Pedobacter sp. PLR]|uniref:GIY-YIG nuclease family protein n=1 Tax=Pedobacter sp. PLR TaxID=2994465 RepID=UPI00224616E4|nr:GIY-YIG nuclease family protein [Pedobacter sp. PLR]MCX2453138.1 GIY-YIG nuclease family protein [Pedobacter sp. PLR]